MTTGKPDLLNASKQPAERFLLGTDIGTGSVKSVLIGTDGLLAAEAVYEYPMYHPHHGWAENDPEDWFRGVVDTVSRVVSTSGIEPERIAGFSIVSQRDPVVMLDAQRRVLGPSISWTDRRTQMETRDLCAKFGKQRLIDIAGVVPIPGLTLPCLLWTQRHQPEVWRQVDRILFAKDYVLYRLTGVLATDTSTPARSMMCDIRRDAWSEEICEDIGIDIDKLPLIKYRPWQVWDQLPSGSAKLLGLPAGIVIAAGGGDDPSAAFGAGAVSNGDLCAGTGTASDWRIVTDTYEPDLDGRGDMAPHVIPNRYLFNTTISSTGSSLRWFRDTFGFDVLQQTSDDRLNNYAYLVEAAKDISSGSDGLFYYPYLEGARSPRFNDDATGVFFGIMGTHTRSHFIRALLEGIAFQYPPTIDILRLKGLDVNWIAMVDGETRSALWNQIKADVVGTDIHIPKVIQSAAVGSAMLAGMSSGIFPDAETAVQSMVHWAQIYTPDPHRHAEYEAIRKRYEAIYSCLEGAYRCALEP
jgi:xylulokinase